MRLLFYSIVLFLPLFGHSQVNSIDSGDWEDPDTWDCGCIPNSALGTIRINPSHTVSITTTVTYDDILISADGVLTIADGGRLILEVSLAQELADPPTTLEDGLFTIEDGGILENLGVVESIPASMIFEDGSEYQHNQHNGAIPLATWELGSTCRITGWGGTNANSAFRATLAQSFYHFIWDSPGQTVANVQLLGSLNTVNGNLVVNNTTGPGPGNRMISFGGNNITLSVGGNFIVSSLGRVSIANNSGSGTFAMNVLGNCTLSSTVGVSNYQIGSSNASAISTLNITGDLVLNSGELNLAPALGAGNVNVGGNLELNGGSIIKPGAGTGNLSFIGVGNHDFEVGSGTFVAGNLIAQGGTLNITGNPLIMAGNITIQSGATFNMPATITTSADLQFNTGSIINSNAGTVTLIGSTLTQIVNANGATLNNLTIDKSIAAANINLTSSLSLTGLLSVISAGSGTVVNSNGNLTLLSTSDGTTGNASIGPLLNTASIAGNVTTQRFMSPEGRIYRYISSPVTNAPVTQLQDDFPITGSFTGNNNGACTGCSSAASMFSYNATLAQYAQFPVSSNSEQLAPGRGYSAFIRQNVAPLSGNPVTIDLTGPINQGDISLPVVHNGTAPGGSWNLVGNPYPSSIDWDDGSWVKTNIAVPIAIKDIGSGNFRYWDGDGDPNGIVDGVIASGQGFWVRTLAASPQLIVRENAKSIATGEFYRAPGPHALSMTLSKGSYSDKAFFKLRTGALLEMDSFDAPKLTNDTLSFSTHFVDSQRQAINAVDQLPCGTELYLDIEITKSDSDFVINPLGNYSIAFDIVGSEFEKYDILLLDSFADLQVPVNSGFNYAFTITEDPASFVANRLKLVFQGKAPDLTLALIGPDFVCGTQDILISVKDSETLFDYFVMTTEGIILTQEATGTGNDLSFTIPGSLLVAGNNQLQVGIRGVCGVEFLNNSQMLTRYEDAAISVQEGDILVSNHTIGNQWYFNEELIPGAVSQSLRVYNSGKYTVEINTRGCSSRTDINYVVTGLESEADAVSIFPNPFTDRITLTAKDLFDSTNQISISNSIGQEVRNQSDLIWDGKDSGYFSLGDLSDGFYFIRIKTSDSVSVIKVIKDSRSRN